MANVAISRDPAPGHRLPRLCSLLLIFFAGPHTLLVTGDAVIHRERLQRACGGAVKGLHRSMAGLALYLCHHHVRPVREEDVGGKPPDPFPGDLQSPLAERQQLFLLLAVALSTRVAREAGLPRRTTRRPAVDGPPMAFWALPELPM